MPAERDAKTGGIRFQIADVGTSGDKLLQCSQEVAGGMSGANGVETERKCMGAVAQLFDIW